MKDKPYASEPGHWRSRETTAGWFCVIDRRKRIAAGGSDIPCDAPFALWSPETGACHGFTDAKVAGLALNALAKGEDQFGLLTLARSKLEGGAFNQVQSCAEPAELVESGSNSRLRASDVKFHDALNQRFPDDILFDRLEELMTAETTYLTKMGECTNPDWAARAKGLSIAFAYKEGEPIKRQQIISSTAPTSWEDLMKLADKSPVFRDTLLGMLEGLKTQKPPENGA